jgi:arsenate reductase-like glutaredoxin family protein
MSPAGAAARPPVQIFGRKDSRDTQRALRFFKERRIDVSLVDVGVKPPAPAELRRFVSRFGAAALLDRESRAYRDGGLGYLRIDDAETVERLLATPALLRLPLVRSGSLLAVGVDEPAWKEIAAGPRVKG